MFFNIYAIVTLQRVIIKLIYAIEFDFSRVIKVMIV